MDGRLPDTRHEALNIAPEYDGSLWLHHHRGSVGSPHRHDEPEMNLATRGTATYLVGERRYQVSQGVMLWLFPGQDHMLINQSPDFSMWILVVKPPVAAGIASKATEYVPLAEDDPPGNLARVVGRRMTDSLGVLFGEIVAQKDDPPCFNTGIAYALASSWHAFLHAAEVAATIGLHPAVECAVKVLREEDESIPLDDLAERAGLSLSRLSRLFHVQVGMPIVQFRNECRLDRFAAIRRSHRDVNLARAALDAGFGSYAQFYRVYVAAYGKSPRG